MDEMMRDHYATMSDIYARLAGIADERGNAELSEELMRKSFEFDLMSNA